MSNYVIDPDAHALLPNNNDLRQAADVVATNHANLTTFQLWEALQVANANVASAQRKLLRKFSPEARAASRSAYVTSLGLYRAFWARPDADQIARVARA